MVEIEPKPEEPKLEGTFQVQQCTYDLNISPNANPPDGLLRLETYFILVRTPFAQHYVQNFH